MFLFPYSVPNKSIFAVLIGTVSLIVFIITSIRTKAIVQVYFSKRRIVCLFTIVYSSSLLLLFFIPNISPCTRYGKLISTILLVGFLPGYAISEFLRLQIGYLERFVYSVLLSILTTGLLGFLAWNMGGLSAYISTLTLTFNIVTLLAYIFLVTRKSLSLDEKSEIRVNIVHSASVFTILIFLYTAYFTIHDLSNFVPLLGDEFRHVGYSRKILNGYFSWQEELLKTFSTPSYPYLFHLFSAVGATLSKTSIISWHISLSLLLLPLPLFSLMALSKSLTNENKLAVLSGVIFQVFSGFGWISAVLNYGQSNEIVSIHSVAQNTCDIIYSTWMPVIVAPFLIDFSAFLLTLSLITRFDIEARKLCILLSSLVTVSILAHVEKALFLALFGSFLAFLQLIIGKPLFRTRELGVSVLISSLLCIIIDRLAPLSLYSSTFFEPLVVQLLLGLAMVILSLKKFKVIWFSDLLLKNIRALIQLFTLLIVGFWEYEIFIQATPLSHAEVIPLYFLPLKLGCAGLFTLIWLFSLNEENISKYYKLFLILLTAFVTQLIIYHNPIISCDLFGAFTEEFRYVRDILWSVVSITGACGFITLIKKAENKGNQKILSTMVRMFLVSLVMVSAPLSHLLKVQYMAYFSGVNPELRGIFEFMEKANIDRGSSIFAFSYGDVIYSATGVVVYTPRVPVWGDILSNWKNPLDILFTLKYLNISYFIAKKGSPIENILQYFPKVYNDSSFSIYKIVDFSPPNPSGETVLIDECLLGLKALLETGVHQGFQWIDEFHDVKLWFPDTKTFANVLNYDVYAVDGEMHISAKGEKGQKIVILYKTTFKEPIVVEDGTCIVVRFCTGYGTKLLVHVLYDDGTMSNALYAGSPYMSSEILALSVTPLNNFVGKKIIGLRVGVTNKGNEEINSLKAEVDFVGICKTTKTNLMAVLMALSLAEVNYTIAFSFSSLMNDYYNIVLVDEGSHGVLDEILQSAVFSKEPVNVLIIGDLSQTRLVDVTMRVTNQSVTVEAIKIYGVGNFHVPQMTVDPIMINSGEVLASYVTNVGEIPLLLRLNNNSKVNIFYLNMLPLINNIKDLKEEDHYNMRELIKSIFEKALNKKISQNEDLKRVFYLKNKGYMKIEGNISMYVYDVFPTVFNFSRKNLTYPIILNVNGNVTCTPTTFGYVLLTLNGKVGLSSGLHITSDIDSQELKLIVKLSRIVGNGSVEFCSLTSGFPYKLTLSGAPYNYTGHFDVYVTPLSAYLLLKPRYLEGFRYDMQ